MERLILFGILSLPVILISWRTLFKIKSHGFYRFFSWECIIWLFANDFRYWFNHPFNNEQLLSWLLLLISVYLVISGVILLKKVGKPQQNRDEKTLYEFEKTTVLIEQGLYKYIRHPLYSSLLFLTWGIFLKNPTVPLSFVALLSTVFLYLTAIFDEKECIKFFGSPYREYKKRTKLFIPFIF